MTRHHSVEIPMAGEDVDPLLVPEAQEVDETQFSASLPPSRR